MKKIDFTAIAFFWLGFSITIFTNVTIYEFLLILIPAIILAVIEQSKE